MDVMSLDIYNEWDNLKDRYHKEYVQNEISYQTWITPLVLKEVSDYVLYVEAPDDTIYEIVMAKYQFSLQTFIREVTEDINYKVVILKKGEYESKSPKEDIKPTTGNINKKYTFDTFVKGDNNSLAFNAALSVAENPATQYNPLFLYGNSGLGKTHLMYSIKNYINEYRPELKVLYVTSEEFTTDLIESIRLSKDSNKGFREKYRTIDILLIDDIQFILNKGTSQEEFFHTFNALYTSGKQIVISSDKPPKELTAFDDRMISRFEQGLTVDIQPPTYETRMAILKNKAELDGYQNSMFHISDEVFDYIATHIKSNIRELEGALTKIVAYSKLAKNNNIELEFAKTVLQEFISSNSKREITPELIVDIVASHFNLTVEELYSADKSKRLARPRFIAMYLCKTMTDVSYSSIANALHRKDHTTVINGVKNITNDIQTDPNLASTINILKKKISPV